jgi:CHAT domain-containing protein/tetratricopeptide (TPR) repeat protein
MTSEPGDLASARIVLVGLMTLEGLRQAGKDREAMELAEKTLDLLDGLTPDARGPITLTGAASIAAQGGASAMRLERFDRALAFAEREIVYTEQVEGSGATLARGLNNRGLARQELGRWSEAAEDYSAALAAIEQPAEEDTRGIKAAIRNNHASLLVLRGEGEAAMEAMLGAVAPYSTGFAQASGSDHLIPLNNLASIAHQQGRYDEAIGYWERALEDPACDDHARGIFLCNIGESYRMKGEPAKAIEALERAAAAHRKSGSKGPLAIDLHNIALIYQGGDGRRLAAGVLKEAWDAIREVAPQSLYAIQILRLLAMERLVAGDKPRVRAGLKRAIEIYESTRPLLGRTEREHQKALEVFRSVIEIFLYLTLDDSWIDEAGDAIERAKARLWYERLYKLRIAASGAGPITEQLAELESLEAAKLTGSGSETTSEKRLARALDEWESKGLGRALIDQERDIRKVAKLSAHNTLLLNYFVGPNATFAYYAYNGSAGTFRIDITESELRELVDEARYDLLGSATGAPGVIPPNAKRLAGLLLGKVASDLGAVRLIAVMPDGPLWYHPFDAMPISAAAGTTRSLIDVAPVILVPSGAVLQQLRELEDRTHTGSWIGLGVGEPDLGGGYSPIPGTAAQLAAFADAVGERGRVDPLTGREATKVEVIARLPGATHVHIGSHALGDAESRRVGILLSDGEGGSELLASEDLADLRLEADLVFLGGCSTGIGLPSAGEGLTSLARSFILAGSRCVVASLWPILDSDAAQIVRLFYGHLAAGTSVARALWLARREIRDAGGEVRTWGALQILGDGDRYEDRMTTLPRHPELQ